MIKMFYKLLTPLAYSMVFALIELGYTGLIDGQPKTTIDQLCVSFMLSPFMIQIYRSLLTHGYDLYLILFINPLLFWMLEIVGHHTLIYYFGKNHAWHYTTPDALFDGAIRIGYYPLFLMLGYGFHLIDNLSK